MYLFPPLQATPQHIIARNRIAELATAFQNSNPCLIPQNFSMATTQTVRPQPPQTILLPQTAPDTSAEFQKDLISALNFQNQRVSKLVEENHEMQTQFAMLNATLEKIRDLFDRTATAAAKNSGQKPVKEKAGESRETSDQEDPLVQKLEFVERGTDLIEYLYPSSKFTNSLVLEGSFPKILYRERNINIKVALLDCNGNLFKNHEKLVLCVALYTCDSPPRKIETNTSGTKVIKGRNEWPLLEGKSEICIQIREVSSHFRNSSLFLIVYPKQMPPGHTARNMDIDPQKISPMVIDSVVVKARKRSSEEVKIDNLAAEMAPKRFHENE